MLSRSRETDLRAAIVHLSRMPQDRREAVLEQLDDDTRARASVLLAQLKRGAQPTVPDWLATRAANPDSTQPFRITGAARDALRGQIADIGAMPAPEAARRTPTLAGRMLSWLA
ncbi:MAG: hypothetical protein JSS55_06340 [Proteobacteria bacterium]|nr:hypothetical protein [Pseudomonadota bacterium]